MPVFEKTFALVIGIAQYAGIRTLPYTRDASDVAELLLDVEICGYTDVRVLRESEASREAIIRELERLGDVVPPGSTVLIYFSGHGGHIEEGENRGDYLLPVDCAYPDDARLARTSISGQDFTNLLNGIARRADQLVVILDCCHAGGIGETRDLTAAPVDPGLAEGALASLARGRGRAIIAVARAGEPAYVLSGARNGTFTRYLLEGLRGGARGHRGMIRVVDLFDFLQENLTAASPPQQPVFKAEFEQNFPIALHLGGKPGSGETVGGGLGVLLRLAKDPALAPVVDQVRDSLRTARDRIALVVGLKKVHDALHDIQIHQFEQILLQRDRLGRDDQAGNNLARHLRRVASRLKQLGDPASLRSTPDLDLSGRLADLAEAVRKIDQGCRDGMTPPIDEGIWELNDILSVVPSTLNSELMRVVRAMNLRDLFRALLAIQERMKESDVKPEDIRSLAAGGRDLGRLHRDIDDLMLQHDQWQRIDDLMRRIDNNGKGQPSDLVFAWPKLSSLLAKQLDGIDDLFRGEIMEAFEELKAQMASPDLGAKVEPFRFLRGSAGTWFFEVDRRLLGMCQELIPIDAALTVVLTALQETSDERRSLA
jgi:hypothetical protein